MQAERWKHDGFEQLEAGGDPVDAVSRRSVARRGGGRPSYEGRPTGEEEQARGRPAPARGGARGGSARAPQSAPRQHAQQAAEPQQDQPIQASPGGGITTARSRGAKGGVMGGTVNRPPRDDEDISAMSAQEAFAPAPTGMGGMRGVPGCGGGTASQGGARGGGTRGGARGGGMVPGVGGAQAGCGRGGYAGGAQGAGGGQQEVPFNNVNKPSARRSGRPEQSVEEQMGPQRQHIAGGGRGGGWGRGGAQLQQMQYDMQDSSQQQWMQGEDGYGDGGGQWQQQYMGPQGQEVPGAQYYMVMPGALVSGAPRDARANVCECVWRELRLLVSLWTAGCSAS